MVTPAAIPRTLAEIQALLVADYRIVSQPHESHAVPLEPLASLVGVHVRVVAGTHAQSHRAPRRRDVGLDAPAAIPRTLAEIDALLVTNCRILAQPYVNCVLLNESLSLP